MFNDAVLDTAVDRGLKQQGVAEPEMQDAPLRVGMAARNAQRGSSRKSMPQACKITSTKLHWLRLLLPEVQLIH